MKKIIAPQTGVGFELRKGQILRVIDPQGEQVSDLFCFAKGEPQHLLSCARSLDYNENILLSEGHFLYSNRSEKFLEILSDDCGRHDLLLSPCSLRMFQICSGTKEHHPSCHENLSLALKKFGVTEDNILNTFNIFMNVTVDSKGRVEIHSPLSKAGHSISFRAHCDLVVGLTACSHEETNNFKFKPIEYEILD